MLPFVYASQIAPTKHAVPCVGFSSKSLCHGLGFGFIVMLLRVRAPAVLGTKGLDTQPDDACEGSCSSQTCHERSCE